MRLLRRFSRSLVALQIATLVMPGLEALANTQEELLFDGTRFSEEIVLRDVESHTRYEDRVVEDTCYRDEVQGSRQECETHNRQECTPIVRRECRDILRNECTPIMRRECGVENERVCTPITRRECGVINDRVCTPTTRRECSPVSREVCNPISRQVCSPVDRQVCTPNTRRECSNVPRQVCTPTTRRECSSVPKQVCTPTTRRACRTENKCQDVTSEICGPGPGGQRVCRPITRKECKPEQVCENVPDQVCRTENEQVCRDVADQVCRTVDEQQCRDVSAPICRTVTENQCRTETDRNCRTVTENQCRDVADQVCRDVPHERCRDVADQVCRDVPHERCRDVADQVCRQIPDTVCRDVSDQVCRSIPETTCRDVPNVVRIPYACQKTIRVPVEEIVDRSIVARTTVNFSLVPDGVKPQERLLVELRQDLPELRVLETSGTVLLLSEAGAPKFGGTQKEVEVEREFNINLVAKADLERSLKGTVISAALEGENTLKVRVQSLQFPNLLEFAMSFERVRFFITSLFTKTLYEGQLPMGAQPGQGVLEVQPTQNPNETDLVIDLSKLTLKEKVNLKKRYRVELMTRVKDSTLAKVLNAKDLPTKLKSKRTVTTAK